MHTPFKVAVAAGLLALSAVVTSGAATAQQAGSAAARNQRQIQQSYSYDDYGLGAACANRPFAPGCDKRGFW